jgi:nucleotide-binding universal stress UspA family protein
VAQHILIPLDGSDLAETAIDYAERIGKALGWGAVLFSVVPRGGEEHLYVPTTPVIEAGPPVWDRWEAMQARADESLQHLEDAATNTMARAAQRLNAAGVPVMREVGVGKPAETIVHRAAGDDIGLIVMASHGRTGLARLFRGSVADGVVKHTKRPVLVIHPFHEEDDRVVFEHENSLDGADLDVVRRALEPA